MLTSWHSMDFAGARYLAYISNIHAEHRSSEIDGGETVGFLPALCFSVVCRGMFAFGACTFRV